MNCSKCGGSLRIIVVKKDGKTKAAQQCTKCKEIIITEKPIKVSK